MALIYIVEDDDDIREIEEFALMNAGHKTLGFGCAKDFYNNRTFTYFSYYNDIIFVGIDF